MIILVYVSSTPRILGEAELQEILRVSRENNARLGITGMLLYRGGTFLQVLEGPEDAVSALYETICRDGRHRQVTRLYAQEITERMFASWSMGFTRGEHLDDPAITTFLDDPFTRAREQVEGSVVGRMLLSFKEQMQYVS